jgi:hypothetical protein
MPLHQLLAAVLARKAAQLANARQGLRVFRIPNQYAAHPRVPADRRGGMIYEVFALRILAADEAAALAWVSREFDYPEILAAFRGWPAMFRGTEICSRADLEALHGRAATDARERANMEEALTDPTRNLYLTEAERKGG